MKQDNERKRKKEWVGIFLSRAPKKEELVPFPGLATPETILEELFNQIDEQM